MPAAHFTPWQIDRHPCWHCVHFVAMVFEGSAARCYLANGPKVRSSPGNGCSAFDRWVGADDELGPPDPRVPPGHRPPA